MGPGLAGAREIHSNADRTRIEPALAHHDDGCSHRGIDHGGEKATLHEAGRIAELAFAIKADLDPALLRARVQKPPSKQLGGRREG